MPLPVFIGYDPREHDAYKVAAYSVIAHASKSVRVFPLDHMALRRKGIFTRPWRIDEEGKFWDDRDGRPFSTAFSHSRFLVPHLAREMGESWALFLEADMVVTGDVWEVFDHADDQYAAFCVKHDHRVVEGVKMDGQAQQNYNRKNWSSFTLWNVDHFANAALTPEAVNSATGSWLHAFSWLKDAEIGALPQEWNYLVGYTALDTGVKPKNYHFTEGVPAFDGYADVPHADIWRREYFNSLHPSPLKWAQLKQAGI